MSHCVFQRKSQTPVACFRSERDARTYLLLDGRKNLDVRSPKKKRAKKARR